MPPSSDLLSACGIAFAAVFSLLAFLAVVMHLIAVAFPGSERDLGRSAPRRQPPPEPPPEPAPARPAAEPAAARAIDPAVAVAIANTTATAFAGARVTRIEELP